MFLLHALISNPEVKLVVAHVDHGMRPDSQQDLELVAKTAKSMGLPFESTSLNLGGQASEELARDERYKFLRQVAKKHQADAIITAHHRDDQIETILFNILRGTGRLGLSSLRSDNNLLRPLLQQSKKDIIQEATRRGIEWREDPSNNDTKYSRNKIRSALKDADSGYKRDLLDIGARSLTRNQQIEQLLESLRIYKSYRRGGRIFSRRWFNSLEHNLSREFVHYICRVHGVRDLSFSKLETLTLKLKSARPGARLLIDKNNWVDITKRSIRFETSKKLTRAII